MFFWRKKTLFHVEESLPDPEEVKFRFRRRILGLTFIGAVSILAIPIFHTLQADLATQKDLRLFASLLMDSKLLSAQTRNPVSLELSADGSSWKRSLHTHDCHSKASANAEVWPFELQWKLQLKTQAGELVTGNILCVHPLKGVELNDTPIDGGQLLVSAAQIGNDAARLEPSRGVAYVLVSEFGADVQILGQPLAKF